LLTSIIFVLGLGSTLVEAPTLDSTTIVCFIYQGTFLLWLWLFAFGLHWMHYCDKLVLQAFLFFLFFASLRFQGRFEVEVKLPSSFKSKLGIDFYQRESMLWWSKNIVANYYF
jgi:hypothetical protein